MSEQDRGAYAPPTDAPLAFDARQPVRGARPAPLTLIISTLVLVGLAFVIFMFYRSGVRQAGQPPQAIGTPVGDLKSPAPAEAQPEDPAAGLQIYKSEAGEAPEGQPQFAPPPEQPQPRTPAAAPAAPPAPKAAPTTPVVSSPAAAGLKPAQPAPAAPAPKAATPAPAPTPKAAAPTTTAPTPAAKPAAAAATGGVAVQIGAFSSQALADSNWAEAVKTPGGAGKGKHVELVPGKGLYRTTVTGFASRTDAAAFCNSLKAAGKNCFVK